MCEIYKIFCHYRDPIVAPGPHNPLIRRTIERVYPYRAFYPMGSRRSRIFLTTKPEVAIKKEAEFMRKALTC